MNLLEGLFKIPIPTANLKSEPRKELNNIDDKTIAKEIVEIKIVSYLYKNSRPPAALVSEPNNSIKPSHCCADKISKSINDKQS